MPYEVTVKVKLYETHSMGAALTRAGIVQKQVVESFESEGVQPADQVSLQSVSVRFVK